MQTPIDKLYMQSVRERLGPYLKDDGMTWTFMGMDIKKFNQEELMACLRFSMTEIDNLNSRMNDTIRRLR